LRPAQPKTQFKQTDHVATTGLARLLFLYTTKQAACYEPSTQFVRLNKAQSASGTKQNKEINQNQQKYQQIAQPKTTIQTNGPRCYNGISEAIISVYNKAGSVLRTKHTICKTK
jgi:hypothetical protein